jgi:hypothetical protein
MVRFSDRQLTFWATKIIKPLPKEESIEVYSEKGLIEVYLSEIHKKDSIYSLVKMLDRFKVTENNDNLDL